MAAGYVHSFNGTLGHEFVGVINSTGKRVVGEINIPCEDCTMCVRGKERELESEVDADRERERKREVTLYKHHCPRRQCIGIHNHPGCHAQYIKVPRKVNINID